MKIAFFTDTYLPQINGVTKTLGKLEAYLKDSEHEYLMLAPEYPTTREHMSGPSILRFKSILFPVYPECRLAMPLYPNLAKRLDQFKPDLIHVVTPLSIGMAGVRYAKEKKLPLVSSFHTNFDTYLKYYRLQPLENLLWGFFRNFHSNFHTTFCPSNDTLQTLDSKGIDNLKVWSRGIDTDIFSPRHRDISFIDRYCKKDYSGTHPLRFLYAGRIAAEKDLDILKESISKVNKEHSNIEFVFVGDGPYTRTLASETPDNVFFTGYLKGDMLAKAYASCDVFVFPSSTETLGNVVLEAMASGLPVIAVNSGGVKDNVLDGYNGLMAEPRNVKSLTECILKLARTQPLRTQLRKNALNYVQSKTWENVFNKLMDDYTSTLKDTYQIPAKPKKRLVG